jgi:hypothetical protein
MCSYSGLRLGGLIELCDVRLENVFIFWFQVWSLIEWSEVRWENVFILWFEVRGLD